MRALLLAALLALQPQSGRKPNRLIHEKSPYLQQHAYNPVDWYAWGDAAFEKARRENKLIFLSVGYSTCYWCHVMEREVFENEELAALMNRWFVSIKVDREERPDVDRIYMAALIALAGGGGWPMSMFLTPDRRPVYGDSYIPPADFRDVAGRLQAGWNKEPEKIREAGRQLAELLKQQAAPGGPAARLEQAILKKGFEQFRAAYDPHHAGFGTHLKFPRPAGLNFLLRYHRRFREPAALDMTLATLRAMARGGIRDHLGGGYHRYTVDRQWRVPHYEKMLYDQAQLAVAYLDAWQLTRDESFAAAAREILAYVLRVLTHPDGGFYSAEDAESAPDPARPREKKEGAFYFWTRQEIERVLGKQRADAFSAAYGVDAGGKPSNLYAAGPTDGLAGARAELLAAREKRPRPHLDDKVLVSWNGLMISAFARAAQVLDDPAYRSAAQRAARFILARLYDPKSRRFLRRWRDGEARHDAQLEDYAFFAAALLDLYEADFDVAWLERAVELSERQVALFWDSAGDGFFDTTGADATLLYRTKESYDGAEPCGNSVAALNLLRLAQVTGAAEWRERAARAVAAFGARLEQDPESLPQMLVALDYQLDKPKQIILAGRRDSPDLAAMLREVHRRYIPNKILLLADGANGQRFLARALPAIASMTMRDNKATAYICENYACKLPTSDLKVMRKLLD